MKVKVAIGESLRLLTKRDRRLLLVAMVIQVATSALDLIGVLLLGLVGALAVTTIQSQPEPAFVASVADSVGLGALSSQALVGVFASVAAIVLLLKSIVSSVLTRRVFVFLANRQALVSARLVRQLLAQPLTFLQTRSSQQTAYALIQGAGAATISVLGQLVIIVTEVAVLAVLAAALLFIDPVVTVAAIAFFAVVAVLLQRIMGSWASRLGKTGAEADVASLNAIQDAMATYREISVLDRREVYVQRFQDLRWLSASVSADRTFILQVPKYVFEAALVIGGVALAGALFLTKDSVAAVGTLALFLAAASRVMPSMLRLQGAALTLRENAAAAGPTFDLARDLQQRQYQFDEIASVTSETYKVRAHEDSPPPDIQVSNVDFTYPGGDLATLSDVSITVPAGTSLAIVGPSGAGKSTLVDVILGVLEPSQGDVLIGGISPREAIVARPGSISYVPQNVAMVNGSIRENVLLGLDSGTVSDDLIWRALKRARLTDFVSSTPLGLDTEIGENGALLSGGQRQRIGIARALLLEPNVLVLDEATSALDAESESFISGSIFDLRGRTTVVVIAHRLSTVTHVDSVAYLSTGRIVTQAPFNEVRKTVPEFARQASLMGLAAAD